MTNKKLIEILNYCLKLLQNIDLVENKKYSQFKDYQRRLCKAYDEIYELIKVLEADDE